MKIAIIDSGINNEVFENISIQQFRIYNKTIIPESPKDYVGHGTAIASIILRTSDNIELISICPGIADNGIPDKIIDIYDMSLAIEKAIDEKVNIINISMGTTMFSRRSLLDDICHKAYAKGILIVAAQSTDGYPSLPWSCEHIIRVKSAPGSDYHIEIEKESEHITLIVFGELYRVITMDNQKYFAKGNSYAAPYIVSLLINIDVPLSLDKISRVLNVDQLDLEKMLQRSVDIINRNLFFINDNKKKIGNIVLLPFNKEMHSIIRFNGEYSYNVIGVIDSPKKGLIGRDVGDILNIGLKDILIYKNLSDIKKPVDLLVIGFLDQIELYDAKLNLNLILEENLKTTRWNIFSFIPIEKDWITVYKENGLDIYSPIVINENIYDYVCNTVKYKIPISKPVLGVFGTSSAQGKFTLQLKIKQAIEKRQYSCFHLSTENHGHLFDAGFVFADGYANNKTIKLPPEKNIDFLRRIMTYIDNVCTDDLILIGGQSWIIPYDINEQTFMRNAVFLEGTLPDIAVLVINPLIDVKEYIEDSINALKSIYKCKTVSLAFSNYTMKADDKGRLSKKYLSKNEIEDISYYLYKEFNLICGCILDEKYINCLIDTIFKILENS